MTQPAGAPPVREGEILAGKYRVERILGVGGMGVVIAATHLQLDQRVALKFVLPEAIQGPETIERFSREARAAVKLRSDHVARVLDVGTLENGSPYMVMEYLEGRDLGQEVEARGPLPHEEAAEYVLQACEAIAEAHAIGIVHRDLKPQNLFLGRRVDGRPLVKVLDFGISKFSGSQSGENMSLTTTHAVMGSPNYMSPEQLRSARAVDSRSDIWALGVILYELLTGEVPFVATSVTELCAMVLQDTPRPLKDRRPDVPAAFAEVVLRCLEKDPTRRFQSIAALAQALEPFALNTNPGAAQRISAVARESSARGLGQSPHSSQPISVASPVSGEGSGRTSVSWAETQLQKGTQKKAATPKIIGIGAAVAVLLFGGVSIVAWRMTLPRHPSTAATGRAESAAPTVPKTEQPIASHVPSPSAIPPPTATTMIATSTSPTASTRPIGRDTTGLKPPRPNGPPKPDQETPDERN